MADLIQKHLPPTAASKALELHRKLETLLESDQGRRILVPILGLTLGLFFLLVLVLIML